MGVDQQDRPGQPAEDQVTVQDIRTSWRKLADRLAYQRADDPDRPLHPITIYRYGEPYLDALPPALYEQRLKSLDTEPRSALGEPVRLSVDPTDRTTRRLDWAPAADAARIVIAARQIVNNWEKAHIQVAHYDKHVLVYRGDDLAVVFVPLNWPAPRPAA